MSGYVRNTEFSIEFDGQVAKGSLLPLTLPDRLRLEGKEAETDVDVARMLAQILPGYVQGFSGITDAAGTVMTIQEICGLAYFTELVMDIGRNLILAAHPANPKKPSVPSVS